MTETIISFIVNVPVLSVLIALVAPEGLDVGEVLHDRLGVGELLGAQRQQSGDEGRETRRDRGDRHRRAEQEELVRVHAPGEADDEDERDRAPGDEPEDLRQRVELPLQR